MGSCLDRPQDEQNNEDSLAYLPPAKSGNNRNIEHNENNKKLEDGGDNGDEVIREEVKLEEPVLLSGKNQSNINDINNGGYDNINNNKIGKLILLIF